MPFGLFLQLHLILVLHAVLAASLIEDENVGIDFESDYQRPSDRYLNDYDEAEIRRRSIDQLFGPPVYGNKIPKLSSKRYRDVPSLNFRRSVLSYPTKYVNALLRNRIKSNVISESDSLGSSSAKPQFIEDEDEKKSIIEDQQKAEKENDIMIRGYIDSLNKVLRANAVRLQNGIFLRDAMVKAMLHPAPGLYRRILKHPVETEEGTLHKALNYFLGHNGNPYVQKYDRMKLKGLLKKRQSNSLFQSNRQPVEGSRRFITSNFANVKGKNVNYQKMREARQRALYLARQRALKARQFAFLNRGNAEKVPLSQKPYMSGNILPFIRNPTHVVPVDDSFVSLRPDMTSATRINDQQRYAISMTQRASRKNELRQGKDMRINKAVMLNRINTANLMTSALKGLQAKLNAMQGNPSAFDYPKGPLNQINTAPIKANLRPAPKTKPLISMPNMSPIDKKIKAKDKLRITHIPLTRSLSTLGRITASLRPTNDIKPLALPLGSGDTRVRIKPSSPGLVGCPEKESEDNDRVVVVNAPGNDEASLKLLDCMNSAVIPSKRTTKKPGKSDDSVLKVAIKDSSKLPHLLFSHHPNVQKMKPIVNTALPKEMLKASQKLFTNGKNIKKRPSNYVAAKLQANVVNGNPVLEVAANTNKAHKAGARLVQKELPLQQVKPSAEKSGGQPETNVDILSGGKGNKNKNTDISGEVRQIGRIVDEDAPAISTYNKFISNSEIDDSTDPAADALSPRNSALLGNRRMRNKKILFKRMYISSLPVKGGATDNEEENSEETAGSGFDNDESSGNEKESEIVISGSGAYESPSVQPESEGKPVSPLQDISQYTPNKPHQRHHLKWHFYHHHNRNYRD